MMQRMKIWLALAIGCVFTLAIVAAQAEEIGSVDTAFQLVGPDHKIVVEAFDDPGVSGISCYVARAKTGGLSGAVGMAKDPSRFSVACRQVGEIKFLKPIPQQEEVFKQGASFIFKHVRVVRLVDSKRNTLAYLTYSDKVVDGSPDNALAVVAVSGQTIPLKK